MFNRKEGQVEVIIKPPDMEEIKRIIKKLKNKFEPKLFQDGDD